MSDAVVADARRVDPALVSRSCAELLRGIGEDQSREGLSGTPNRVAKFWMEWLDAPPFNLTTFRNDGGQDELIVQRGVPFYSVCEHHLLPFFGTATVAYIPRERIVGLSKLARAVDHYARRPQNQERITTQVADLLNATLAPKGVGVVLEARHMCMEMRGVKVPGATTMTSALRGVVLDDPRTRAEFLSLAGVRL